jgi:predicted dehydrogenase
MASLAFALIGCGPMGRGLADALKQVSEARLTAVADPMEEARQQAAEAHGAEAYAEYGEVLARDDVEAVIVATPTTFHKEVTMAAAQAGKHVFCEKPMALTLADCDAMMAACEKAGRKLMIGQVLRLMFPWARIKELTADDELGPAKCVDITRVTPWGGRGWRGKMALSGGPLFEVNVHELDLMRHLCGEVEQVSAYGGNLVSPQFDFPDVVLLNLRFRAGAVGRLRGGCAGPTKRYDGEVICEHGTAAFGPGWGELWRQRPGAERERVELATWTQPSGLVRELASFTQWVLHEETPLITAADGRAAVELATAAYRSLETGRPVDLPLR